MRKAIQWIASIAFVVFLLLASFYSTRFRAVFISSGLSMESKGYLVAQKYSCFTCHGQWGEGGIPNPGASKIPSLTEFAFLMDVKSEAEFRQWVLNGIPDRHVKENVGKDQRAVKMPAYKGIMSDRELEALVAFYNGVSGTKWPKEPLAEKGYKLAKKHGCFSCHGLAGRFDMPNRGSLVGRIPSWQSDDFVELAENDGEIREWIEHGIPKRLDNNSFARYFIDRAVLKMPAYKGLIPDKDVDAIIAYIKWLRDPKAEGHEPSYSGPDEEESSWRPSPY